VRESVKIAREGSLPKIKIRELARRLTAIGQTEMTTGDVVTMAEAAGVSGSLDQSQVFVMLGQTDLPRRELVPQLMAEEMAAAATAAAAHRRRGPAPERAAAAGAGVAAAAGPRWRRARPCRAAGQRGLAAGCRRGPAEAATAAAAAVAGRSAAGPAPA
jgi:hypothetical protein